MKPIKIALFATVVSLSACGSDEHEGPEAEGCEHMQNGPAQLVSASEEESAAPDIAFEHTRIDIALVDFMGGKGGYVSYASPTATEILLFLNQDVPISIRDSGGNALAFEASSGNDPCPEIVPVQHVVDMEVGTYTFTLGGSATTSSAIGLVIEDAGGAHEH